ncbi:MAG: hypothetical protein MHM6MM_002710 [Cercozoa sp. M6MM]
MSKTLQEGGCHCGAVRFRAYLPREGFDCNCTVCFKKGFLHLYCSESEFELLSGDDALTLYQFGTNTAKHLFCKHCGIYAFYHPRSHPEKYSVNARCLDDIEFVQQCKFTKFDGRGDYTKNRSLVDRSVDADAETSAE